MSVLKKYRGVNNLTTKERFLHHVKERLARAPQSEINKQLNDLNYVRQHFPITYNDIPDSIDAMIDRFTKELEALGGVVKITNSPADTFSTLQELLKMHNSKQIIHWNDESLNECPISSLSQQGYHIMTNRDNNEPVEYKHFANTADTGITGAQFAIAETGSIVVESGIGRERIISLMPKLHIAIAKSNQFVKRTADVFKYYVDNKQKLPSSINFITGPSRSADIENDLSIGVHGPANICIIIERVN